MKTIGGYQFPETTAEASDWKTIQRRLMLHRNVMVIARTRIEGTWKAYCFPVPGMNHDQEEYLWETEGDKVAEPIARAMFPCFIDVPYAK